MSPSLYAGEEVDSKLSKIQEKERLNILLVEANTPKPSKVKQVLKPCFPSHQIADAHCVDGALLMLSQKSFDAVLIEQGLPLKGGLNLLQHIQQLPIEQRCAIVIISENEGAEQAFAWLSEGAQDWIARRHLSTDLLKKTLLLAKHRFQQEITFKQSLAESKERAEKDHLTGIANRCFFESAFTIIQSKVIRRHTGLALLLFDLDHFKEVNDTFGHHVGDQVLKCVATRLSEFTRTEEVFARLGGDEFVLIVTGDNSNSDAIRLARRILNAIREPMQIDGKVIRISASIGIAAQQSQDQSITTLLSHADIALYQAKNSGRSRLCFFQKDVQRNFERNQHIEAELKHAVTNKLFDLHYQPIVRLDDLTKAGYEAYLRLLLDDEIHHAGSFIHCAEEADVLWEMGHWSIETAISTQRVLQAQHPDNDLFISINLSYKQLEEEQLIEYISNSLELYQVSPKSVVIELTEKAFRGHSAIRTANIHKLADFGFRIAIDNFGSGATCVESLQNFPIHQVKITESLIQDASKEKYLHAVIAMLQALNLSVVLKGVETEAQYKRLKERYTVLAQGNYFEAPQPQALLHYERTKERS